jgi:hypothetical protein
MRSQATEADRSGAEGRAPPLHIEWRGGSRAGFGGGLVTAGRFCRLWLYASSVSPSPEASAGADGFSGGGAGS